MTLMHGMCVLFHAWQTLHPDPAYMQPQYDNCQVLAIKKAPCMHAQKPHHACIHAALTPQDN